MRFLIIASGFNCEKLAQKCIESIKNQTYKNFYAVFISDGSTDGTGEIIEENTNSNRDLEADIFNMNMGAAYRRFCAIRDYGQNDDVIILVGLDDELMPNALDRIKQEYDKGAWMTYGNWVNQHGKGLPRDFALHFDPETHIDRNYRKVRYRSTAPNTFKKFLFDHLDEEDFKVNGEWVKATTESSLMFSCLEMCGKERIGVIEDQIYLYNQGRPDNARKRFGNEYQDKIYQDIINRPKKPLLLNMKVEKSEWEQKAKNLQDRRKFAQTAVVNAAKISPISDYKSHIEKCFMGKDILDVGCGSCAINEALNDAFNHNEINSYTGIDPFPIKPQVLKMQAEKMEFHNGSFDTVYAFAMLDNVEDFNLTVSEMKRVCRKNIVILTGVNIIPDKFHTLMITEEKLIEEMKPFKVGYKEYLAPKVLLIEFIK